MFSCLHVRNGAEHRHTNVETFHWKMMRKKTQKQRKTLWKRTEDLKTTWARSMETDFLCRIRTETYTNPLTQTLTQLQWPRIRLHIEYHERTHTYTNTHSNLFTSAIYVLMYAQLHSKYHEWSASKMCASVQA